MDRRIVQAVRQRARHRCEYCQMPLSAYATTPFPIDHIVARQHGGGEIMANLALSCLHCNSHKGPNIAGIDPHTGILTRLFNPRRHKWKRHFKWNDCIVIGRTPIGRATINVLRLNSSDLIAVRQALKDEGRFPPAD